MVQQRPIRVSRPPLRHVVGMDQKTHQAMSLRDESNLSLPEIYRVLVEDVEERVILRRGQRQLQNSADEERHHGAAAASLGVQDRKSTRLNSSHITISYA